ncbi:uncharacterized protein LOC128829551 isoform X4 [Malaclemys terrapin pileata]|uniref:uncharacterized protein LOC128829551 isoform X4 n=1 Tax=Malaclemys terrapin pileata TaxID=2991368 RepID=UPI0023A794DA|nr:uncharacterized protein LOC128829551 isoform X4 [Malaclemys terrapin pileata]
MESPWMGVRSELTMLGNLPVDPEVAHSEAEAEAAATPEEVETEATVAAAMTTEVEAMAGPGTTAAVREDITTATPLEALTETTMTTKVQEDGASCSTLKGRDTETRRDSSAQGGRHTQEFAPRAPACLSWMGPMTAVGRAGHC